MPPWACEKKILTPTWFEHAAFWSGVRRATVAPRSQVVWGPTEIWTRIAGFRVQSANRYTIRPWIYYSLLHSSTLFFMNFQTLKENRKGLLQDDLEYDYSSDENGQRRVFQARLLVCCRQSWWTYEKGFQLQRRLGPRYGYNIRENWLIGWHLVIKFLSLFFCRLARRKKNQLHNNWFSFSNDLAVRIVGLIK